MNTSIVEQMQQLETSDNGIGLIIRFEGFSSKPYYCPAGVCTIGFGSTYYPDGRKVRLTDKPITQGEGITLLHNTLKKYEQTVRSKVKVPLTQNQFDALVSFTYNVGERNFLDSTLLAKLNSGRYSEVPRELNKWVRANGEVLKGLVKRRKAEGELFVS